MKLPALGGAVGIERFKELDGGCYDHRRVPVFGGQPLPAFCIIDLLVGIKGRAGVMLDHVGFPQDPAKHFRVLLNDGGIGDHIDDPTHIVFYRVAQRKGQRGDRLAAAGGHGQGINALGTVARVQTALQNLTAAAVQVVFRREEACNMPLQPVQKYGKGIVFPARNGTAGHKFLGVQIIRIDQTGIEHPRPERTGKIIAEEIRFRRDLRQITIPGVGRDSALNSPLQPPDKGGIPWLIGDEVSEVRQSAVMAHHAASGHERILFGTLDGPGCGVVDLRAVVKTSLKSLGGFSDVMGLTHEPAEIRRAEFGGKSGAASGSTG